MSRLFEQESDRWADYTGLAERPADYEEYWARGLREVDGLLGQEPKLEAAGEAAMLRSARCSHFRFTGPGGAEVHAQYLVPKQGEGPFPAVVVFHGYWSSSGEWSGKLGYIAEGYAVLAMDTRGQGGLSEDNGSYRGNTQSGHIIRGVDSESPDGLFYRNVFLDTALAVRLLMKRPEIRADRVFVTGESQGGALALAAASLVPELRGCAAVYPFLCDFAGNYRNYVTSPVYEELTWYFRTRDPLHRNEARLFDRLAYIDITNRAPYIEVPVLLFTGLQDRVCPPSGQAAAFNRIPGDKEQRFYPEYGHEYLPEKGDQVLEWFADRLR